GKAQLASWLAHLLGEEGRALKLPLYTQRPEDLAEQLPRIEQLLAWLHHARQVLESPDLDRLFGELNKLHELANLPISDEVLEARVHQAMAVFQSRGWKHLLRK
ncbi:inorganic triphosphatase, partial [Pseudomonas frederiksbergensis]|nr:inorganic triphosphatase [Pseudomonas frederiksbergensis]